MDCPWAGIKQDSINFTKILNEEISKDLLLKKTNKQHKSNTIKSIEEKVQFDNPVDKYDGDVQSDEIIAQLLQMEYDNEHRDELKKSESQINEASKISISFDNYARVPLYYESENDEEQEVEDFIDLEDWDSFDEPLEGYKNQASKDYNKIKSNTEAKQSTCDLLLNLDIEDKNAEKLELKLPDRICNELKLLSNQKQARQCPDITKVDKAMVDVCVNQFVNVLLYKMIQVDSIVNIGKHAMIFHAYTKSSFPHSLPKECVAKVYKSTLSEFNQLNKNSKGNHFQKNANRFAKKQSIQMMAEKEKAALIKLQKAGVRCPRVITLKSGILVTSFIGKNGKSAPTFHNAVMSVEEVRAAVTEIVEAVRTMYMENIIHGELSEHNIFWHNKHCYIVDFGRCIETTDKNAFADLYRDCTSMARFFQAKYDSWWTPLQLMQRITELFTWYNAHGITLEQYKQAFKLKHQVISGK